MARNTRPRRLHLCDYCVLALYLLSTILEAVSGAPLAEMPTAKIVVHVRKRREKHWDFWQINSNVCPPSLCHASSENGAAPPPRPRGTVGVFYQGDIVLDKGVDHYIFPEVNHTRYRRATVRLRNRLWPDGIVPYTFHRSLSQAAKQVLLRAFRHIQKRTCVRFRERKEEDKDYIRFISEPGCWSAIGRTGGRQLVSLGRGCENIGTAVHEVTHALGVWHEQARNDRDKYVEIEEENISDRFLPDFEKVSTRVATSRGYPYDYMSVMHYSKYAFTRNGKPTIKVIGIGEKLGLTLEQRNGLSTIDMAQLREMYRCNLHQDTNETQCPEGWIKHETECYKFFKFPKVQFAAASKHCKELNSHLLFIETKREDEFISSYLLQNFPYEYTWRVGGKRINDTMMWYKEDSNPVPMDYTNWGKGHPGTYSTVALQRDRTTNVTEWQGVWAGSLRQLPYYIYPFICERRAKRSCLRLRYKDGRDYRGKLDHTIDGYTCQKWTEIYPHQHNLTTPTESASNSNDDNKEDADGLGDHNYCRNPEKERRSRPWCYTTKKNKKWQFCDISACRTSTNRRTTNPKPTTRPPTLNRIQQSSSNSDPRQFPSNSGNWQTSSSSGNPRRQLPDSAAMRELTPSSRPNRRNRPDQNSAERTERNRRRRNRGRKRRHSGEEEDDMRQRRRNRRKSAERKARRRRTRNRRNRRNKRQ